MVKTRMEMLILAALVALIAVCIVLIARINKQSALLESLERSVDLLGEIERWRLTKRDLNERLQALDEKLRAKGFLVTEIPPEQMTKEVS
jgi:hypothetical protein